MMPAALWAIAALLALLAVYMGVVEWRMRRPYEIRYGAVMSPLLRQMLGSSRPCTTLWHTCYVHDRTTTLNRGGWIHERYHMTAQWDRWPYSFPIRYLWEMRHGYGCNKFEEAARLAAGEPSECTKVTA